MKKEITCIVCPNGCNITAFTGDDGAITSITGYTCPRGEVYAKQELVCPLRTVTSSVRVQGGEMPLASVRLTRPVPKSKIFDVMAKIKDITLKAPVKAGTVIDKSILGYDSDLIATKDVNAVLK